MLKSPIFCSCKGKAKDDEPHILKFASNMQIKRNMKIKADAPLYDPKYTEHFKERRQRERKLITGWFNNIIEVA